MSADVSGISVSASSGQVDISNRINATKSATRTGRRIGRSSQTDEAGSRLGADTGLKARNVGDAASRRQQQRIAESSAGGGLEEKV